MDYFSDDEKSIQSQLRPKHINAMRADIAAALSAFDRAADWAVSFMLVRFSAAQASDARGLLFVNRYRIVRI